MSQIKTTRIALTVLSLFCAGQALASELDVASLDERVNSRVMQMQELGFLPTSVEIEHIRGDIVDAEICATGMSISQAVEQYQLTPTLTRYILIKEMNRITTSTSNISSGEIDVPPPVPP